MSNMNDLYNKVAGDPILQQKFSRIMADAEQAGQEATEEKLLAFAWEAGFEVSIAEIQAFFQGMAAQTEGELSDAELDQVAGGKSQSGGVNVFLTVVLTTVCALTSIVVEVTEQGQCGNIFK